MFILSGFELRCSPRHGIIFPSYIFHSITLFSFFFLFLLFSSHEHDDDDDDDDDEKDIRPHLFASFSFYIFYTVQDRKILFRMEERHICEWSTFRVTFKKEKYLTENATREKFHFQFFNDVVVTYFDYSLVQFCEVESSTLFHLFFEVCWGKVIQLCNKNFHGQKIFIKKFFAHKETDRNGNGK